MLKSIKNAKNLKGKTVLVRCDFDVPIEKGIVKDDARLKSALGTIEFLFKKGAKMVLMGHLGRPESASEKDKSLLPVAKKLVELLDENKLRYNSFDFVANMERYVGKAPVEVISEMQMGDIVMLENLRFSDRESKNCRRFARRLAELGDVYVNEAFAVSHRSASSMDAIQEMIPSFSGLHLEKEIRELEKIRNNPKKPLTLIMGGVKAETKLPVIDDFIGRAKYICVGGALANNFIASFGFEIGKSLYEKDMLDIVKRIYKKVSKSKKTELLLPVDFVTDKRVCRADEVKKSEKILDIGPETIKIFQKAIDESNSCIWNGFMGKYEEVPYQNGTKKLVNKLIRFEGKVVAGGGETGEVLRGKKLSDSFFVSVGGGAMLKFLAGDRMAGIK